MIGDLIRAISFPRLYLHLGKGTLRAVVTTYCVALLALAQLPYDEIYALYAGAHLFTAMVMYVSWQGMIGQNLYAWIMKIGLLITAMASTYLVYYGYALEYLLLGVAIIYTAVTVVNHLSGALARAQIQEKGEDGGMAVFQIILPISIGVCLFLIGALADISFSWVFVFTGLFSILLILLQVKYSGADIQVPKRMPVTNKVKRLLFMDMAINAGFLTVARVFMPVYFVLIAKELGFGSDVLKFLGLITSVLVLFGLVQRSFKSSLGKWKLASSKLMLIGMVGYSAMILLWGILDAFLARSFFSLGLIFLTLMAMQIFSPLWNVGYFSELRKSAHEDNQQPEETYRSYSQLFAVFLNLGAVVGLGASAVLLNYLENYMQYLLIAMGVWCLTVCALYWLVDRAKG